MRQFNKLSLTLNTGLRSAALGGVILGLAVAAPAQAQDADECDPETETCETVTDGGNVIVVTGSILRRSNAETVSPVTTLSADSLEERGISTAAEAMQRLAANGSGTIGEGWNNGNNFAAGANAASLRGLTVQKTLTVFDGLRMAPYPLADDGHRNFVDLNTIPDAIIDRIEVQRDGASSTYGADAVAGVINVITKKQVTGLHANAAVGTYQQGGAMDYRIDLTAGHGDLDEQGFNIYVNGMYRKNEVYWARDLDYPFNTGYLGGICDDAGHCMGTGTRWYQFGVNPNGTLAGSSISNAPMVARGTATGGRTTEYSLLNTDCAAFGGTPIQLPNTARGFNAAGTLASWAVNQCSVDMREQLATARPDTERYGFSTRATARLGDSHEFYISGNYMHGNTYSQIANDAFPNATTVPGAVTFNPIVLPIYVCANGVGSFVYTNATTAYNTSTGCTNAQGAPLAGATLNPNNPYAASGGYALFRGRYDRPRTVETDNRALRGAAGIAGTFGALDQWNYSVDFTASQVQVKRISENYLIPQRIADVIAKGTYNFVEPWKNTQAVRDYVSPTNTKISTSDLWQVQAILGRELLELPGGALQAAVGASYREESINDPSANPANDAHPFERYYGVNAVGAVGSRNVKSGFYEIEAPVLDSLLINASGRYDDYSSGQTNFSPKFGAKFRPIDQVMLRGTWSKGFRIPSFNEAFGLPTTGYTTLSVNCVTYAAFCSAHNGNNYVTGQFSLGRTSTGNPALDPEKSTSWNVGFVFDPVRNLTIAVDYFNIKVKDVIGNISAADQTAALDAYYKNGTTNAVQGVTVVPGIADVQFPNATPLPGFIQFSFQNADTEKVSGVDFSVNYVHDFGDLTWSSNAEVSYLNKYEVVRKDGSVERYDGSLSPCDYTSCSGSPKWRGTWDNTLSYGPFSTTLSAYYTHGYDFASVDYGGVKGDCIGNVGHSVVAYQNTAAELLLPVAQRPVLPVKCDVGAQWNFDLSMRYQATEFATVYANIYNVFGIDANFDPSAAYSIFQYNPAWAQPNALGRAFRVGVKIDY